MKPRRATVALRTPPTLPSKPSATSLRLPASIRSRRSISSGSPVCSSSPVNATMTFMSCSAPTAFNACRAIRMTRLPPFMSATPGPFAIESLRS